MATITYTIDNAKLPDVIAAMKYFYPIPMIPDPDWVDPQDGSQVPIIPQFTDNQWAKEVPRRWIVSQVRRHKQVLANEAAIVQADDTIII